MEHSYFFNSVNGDRTYQAGDFAKYFEKFVDTGVYQTGDALEVTADGMNTTVATGSAFIEGHMYENDSDLEFTHEIADPNQNRIDLVILRLDKNQGERSIKADVLRGTPSSNPVAPELESTDYVTEIPLAEILIASGQSFIDSVTDRRGTLIKPLVDGSTLDAHLADYESRVLEKTEIDFPFNSGFSSTNNATISKVNKLVTVTVGLIADDVFIPNTDTLIGTLPIGYRPNSGIVTPVGFSSSSWSITTIGYCMVGSNGNLHVKVDSDVCDTCYFHISFFTG